VREHNESGKKGGGGGVLLLILLKKKNAGGIFTPVGTPGRNRWEGAGKEREMEGQFRFKTTFYMGRKKPAGSLADMTGESKEPPREEKKK